jgi:hypothetical protein
MSVHFARIANTSIRGLIICKGVYILSREDSVKEKLTHSRHVRVHHVDKKGDDPQLRDVLAQRPEGGSRGRRRRVSGPEP